MAIALLTFTCVVWGLTFISIKVVIDTTTPIWLGFIRFCLASLILYVMLRLSGQKPRLRQKDFFSMAGTGLLGVTIYFLFENNGIKMLSASEASIVVGTIPVLTVIVDGFVKKSSFSLRIFSGALLSFAGVSIMVLESLHFSGSVLGYLYMGGAALAWVAYSFAAKKLEKSYSSMETVFWHSIIGAVGFVPFLFAEHPAWGDFTLLTAGNILFLAVLGSALGYLFYIRGLAVLGASVTNIFINLIPVISVLSAFIFLKEKISLIQYLGGSAAIIGVFIVNKFVPEQHG